MPYFSFSLFFCFQSGNGVFGRFINNLDTTGQTGVTWRKRRFFLLFSFVTGRITAYIKCFVAGRMARCIRRNPKPMGTQTSAGPQTNTTTNPDRDVRNCTIVIAGRLMLRGCRRWCGQWYGQLTAGNLRRAGCRRVFSQRVRPTEYKRRRSTPVRKFSLLGGPSSAHNMDWCPHSGLLLSWSYINQQAGRDRERWTICARRGCFESLLVI